MEEEMSGRKRDSQCRQSCNHIIGPYKGLGFSYMDSSQWEVIAGLLKAEHYHLTYILEDDGMQNEEWT
jgi:hypothetical protein